MWQSKVDFNVLVVTQLTKKQFHCIKLRSKRKGAQRQCKTGLRDLGWTVDGHVNVRWHSSTCMFEKQCVSHVVLLSSWVGYNWTNWNYLLRFTQQRRREIIELDPGGFAWKHEQRRQIGFDAHAHLEEGQPLPDMSHIFTVYVGSAAWIGSRTGLFFSGMFWLQHVNSILRVSKYRFRNTFLEKLPMYTLDRA